MANKTAALLPSTSRLLADFGERLKLARLRRRLTAKLVAERAGMSLMTLRSLEAGGAGVTIGAYVSVMQVLGMVQDIAKLAADDQVGRQLQDAQMVSGRASQTGKSAGAKRGAIEKVANSRKTVSRRTANNQSMSRKPFSHQVLEPVEQQKEDASAITTESLAALIDTRRKK
ncbi:XRE family transcriptional regulator [Advenella kashmirensis W13003]|uniref:XRE family transcriptional regulator n=1 Tax=Advenella kashmirensis W13003 TaxID=1424334 RepID=V8QUX8_9BURK|nr:helix-turn-helix domain-containing protein [Advenella kashmirensis]ETF02814.1 XRE family transcriptional regulator [Advenella kashmirensis W13003]